MKTIALCLLLPLAACASDASSKQDTPGHQRASAQEQDLSGLGAADMLGNQHDLAQLQTGGKAFALVFWQTWCTSCIAEAPKLALASREHPEINFRGVLSGPDDLVDKFEVLEVKRKMGLNYPQLRDRDLSITEHFDVKGTPTIIVFDSSGKLAYRGHEVPPDWSRFSASNSPTAQ